MCVVCATKPPRIQLPASSSPRPPVHRHLWLGDAMVNGKVAATTASLKWIRPAYVAHACSALCKLRSGRIIQRCVLEVGRRYAGVGRA